MKYTTLTQKFLNLHSCQVAGILLTQVIYILTHEDKI